ncbi:MAG: alpha/beta fold hydrolase [Kiritimatiellia bacterium]
MKRTLTTLATVLLIWIGGNLIHLLWIKVRHHIWNRNIVRDEQGLMEYAKGFSCGSGSTALIFIHGFADLPKGWERITRRLTNRYDYACHAIRIPRWGETLVSQQGVTMDEIRNVIDLKISDLSKDHDNIWLVGHSMGGALAIDTIPRNTENINGLAVLAPLIRVSDRRVPFATARFWFYIGKKLLWLNHTLESPFSEKVIAADDPDFSYSVDRFIPYSIYDILFEVTRNNRNINIPSELPVFCALSADDAVIDNDTAKAWFNGLKSEKKKLYIDRVAGHTLHIGKNWKEITDELGAFVYEN